MNEHRICENVDDNCFSVEQLSEPFHEPVGRNFEIGGYIDFDHKGTTFHILILF